MPLEGSPKKFAEDVALGLIILNKAVFKKYSPPDFKVMMNALQNHLRDVRAEFVDQNDFDAIKKKNYRMQKLNQAMMMISTYCKTLRIPL